MAASDPSPYVATPTGTLQGVAAFSWDGSAWQPSGRAGPSVATPTGALQGVAPFAWDGAAWQPSGRAQPGVAAPGGVLDGVAVYTWSGSAWTPASGTATPSTPSGALRGVAAFSWDGAAWQPAAQARASVPTPYGALDGVAFFNWGGSAWQAGAAVPAGAALDLSFLSGTLDPRITFTRASTATYFDSSGVMQTAASGAPRFDYDPVTHVLRGLLIEEARTNLLLWSTDFTNAVWQLFNGATKGGLVTGPGGVATGMTVNFSSTGASQIFQSVTIAAGTTLTVWARANTSNSFALKFSAETAQIFSLTSQWQRFSLTCVGANTNVGISNSAGVAGSIDIAMPQVELGGFATSYIPTTAATVARVAEVMSLTDAALFLGANGKTIQVEGLAVQNMPAGQDGYWIMLHDVGNTNLLELITPPSTSVIQTVVFQSPTTYANGAPVALTRPTIFKAALANSTVWNTAVNGALAPGSGGASAIGTGAYTALHMGCGSTAIGGYIRRVRFWQRALSQAELQSVTT
jgi:hypothetical protein